MVPAAVEVGEVAATVELSTFLVAIADELARVTAECRQCEQALGSLIASIDGAGASAGLGLQALDYVTQHVDGLTEVVTALAIQAPASLVHLAPVLEGVRLSALSRRLAGQPETSHTVEEYW